ncbi:hypothetical protein RFI_21522, partial [Reticulomyxa filosa]
MFVAHSQQQHTKNKRKKNSIENRQHISPQTRRMDRAKGKYIWIFLGFSNVCNSNSVVSMSGFWEYTKDISVVNRFIFPIPKPPSYDDLSYPDELIFVPKSKKLKQNFEYFYGKPKWQKEETARLRRSSKSAKKKARTEK